MDIGHNVTFDAMTKSVKYYDNRLSSDNPVYLIMLQ